MFLNITDNDLSLENEIAFLKVIYTNITKYFLDNHVYITHNLVPILLLEFTFGLILGYILKSVRSPTIKVNVVLEEEDNLEEELDDVLVPSDWSGPFYGFYLWKEQILKKEKLVDSVSYSNFEDAVDVVDSISDIVKRKWPDSCIGITKDKIGSRKPYRIRLGYGGTPIYKENSESWLYSWVKGDCIVEETDDTSSSITLHNKSSDKWTRRDKYSNNNFRFLRDSN
jgi:hypothetical protein